MPFPGFKHLHSKRVNIPIIASLLVCVLWCTVGGVERTVHVILAQLLDYRYIIPRSNISDDFPPPLFIGIRFFACKILVTSIFSYYGFIGVVSSGI